VTGFHAGYISENNIGKNTKMSLIRAGDVIPHITGIIESTKAKGVYDYQYIYTHNGNFAFDEYDHLGVSYTYLNFHKDRFYSGFTSDNRVYDHVHSDITHFRDKVKDDKKSKKIILYSYKYGQLERLIYENKLITHEETLYVHFMKRPMDICTDSTDQYYIAPNKFVTWNENPKFSYMWINGRKKIIDVRNIKAKLTNIRAALKIGTRYRNIKVKLGI